MNEFSLPKFFSEFDSICEVNLLDSGDSRKPCVLSNHTDVSFYDLFTLRSDLNRQLFHMNRLNVGNLAMKSSLLTCYL